MSIYDDILAQPEDGVAANQYDAMLQSEGQDKQIALKASMAAAARTQPDRAARVQQLAKKHNLPAGVVDRQFDAIQKRDTRSEYDRILASAPKTAEWLRDPNNASVASDDVDSLAAIEITASRLPNNETGFLGNVGRGIVDRSRTLTGNFLQALANTADVGEDYLANLTGINPGVYWDESGIHFTTQMPTESDVSIAASLRESGDAVQGDSGYEPRFTWDNFKGDMSAQNLAGFIFEQGAVSLPDMAAALTMMPAYVASRTEEIAETRVENDERETVTGADLGSSLVPAVASALLERIGGEAVLFGRGGSIAGDVANAATKEAATEFVQENIEYAGGTVGTRAGYDPMVGLEQGLAGAVAGGGFGGGVRASSRGVRAAYGLATNRGKAQEAQQTQAALDEMAGNAQASKTVQRAPEQAEAFIKSVKGNERVYVPAQQWDTYFQSQDIDPRTAYEQVTGQTQGYDEAQATGTDIEIPTEKFATRIAANPEWYAGLRDDVRLRPDAFTPREAREFDETAGEQVQAFLDEAGEPEADTSTPILDDVRTQLLNANVEPTTAERQAQLTQSVFRTLAERTGQDANALYQRYGVEIRRDVPDELRAMPTDELAAMIEQVRAGNVEDNAAATVQAELNRLGLAESDADTAVLAQTLKGELNASEQQGVFQRMYQRVRDAVSNEVDGNENGGAFLYHGTTEENLSDIAASGRINGPAYFTPRSDMAGEYADGGPVIPVRIDREKLKIDLDLPGGRLLTVAEANSYLDHDPTEWGIDDYLREGYSVGVDNSVRLSGADYTDLLSEYGIETTYYQSRKGQKRGRIEFTAPDGNGNRTFRVTLTDNADLSTFLHESAHLYLEVLGDLAGQPDASPQVMADYKTVMDWFGVSRRDQIKTGQHEKFARGFERYLMEGKAPTPELQSAFARFRAWLVAIYRDVKALRVSLNDNVRAVFDRLVATDDQIAEASAAQGYDELFTSAEDAGMTEAEFAAYRETAARAREEAEHDMTQQAMRDITREQKAWWQERKAAVREQVAADVNARPVYRAIDGLKDGQMPDGTPIKLSKADIVEQFGADRLKKLPGPGNKRHSAPYLYTVEGGLPADVVADMYGFSSGDELLTALERARPADAVITAETNQRMREEYGDILTDGTIAEKAMQAVHNDQRDALMLAELSAIRRKQREVRPYLRAAENERSQARTAARDQLPTQAEIRQMKAAAERIIGQRSVRDIQPNTYRVAERRAMRESFEAMGKDQFEQAYAAKRRQILNHELYRAATAAREEADKIRQYAKKFDRKTTRQRLGKAGEYLERIDELLGRYEFRNITLKRLDSRQSLREWLDDQDAPTTVPDEVLDEAGRRNWREVPLEELRGVRDAIKQIEHLASLKGKLLAGKEQRDLDEVVSEVTESIYRHGGRSGGGIGGDQRRWKELRTAGKEWLSMVSNADTILRELDGFENLGGVYRNIKGVLDTATSEGLLPRQAKVGEELDALYAEHYDRKSRRRIAKDRFYVAQVDESFTKEQILSMALNWGNKGNRQAVLDGFKLKDGRQVSETNINAILAKLDKRDWDFVQATWDYIDSFWPEIQAAQKRRTGVAPPKVEPMMVQTQHGDYRGGYYPLKYDNERSLKVSEEEIEDAFESLRSGRFARAQTARDHTIERVGSGGRPVKLSLAVFHGHLNNVVTDLEMGDAINYSYRVLNDKRVREAFEATDNKQAHDALDVWLKDTAVGEMVGGRRTERYLRHLRTGFTLSVLGFNLGTALIQPTGYLQTVVQIRPKYAMQGLQQLLRTAAPGPESAWQVVSDKSGFMRHRLENFNKDIRDAQGELSGGMRNWKDAFSTSAFWLIGKTQQVVDTAAWLGAYSQAIEGQAGPNIEAGNEADAVLYADRMVARSQSSGIFGDRSAVERGTWNQSVRQTELVRIWTALASYMISKGNIAYERTRIADFKNPGDILTWALDMGMLFTVEAMIIGLMRGFLPDWDDDDTGAEYAGSLAGYAARETAYSILGTQPIIREFASESQGFRGGSVLASVFEAYGSFATQSSQGEVDTAFIKDANSLGGIFLKYPASQMNRAIDAYGRAQDGEDVPWYEYFIYRQDDED